MKLEITGLKDLELSESLESKLKGLLSKSKHKLEIGFFENAKYQSGVNVAKVAFINEYGNLNQPPRPFFRVAIDKNTAKWFNVFKNQFLANNSLELSLNQVGEVAKGDVVSSITALTNPALKESTIKRKGSSKPLIDTGFLRASVNFKVVKNA